MSYIQQKEGRLTGLIKILRRKCLLKHVFEGNTKREHT